VYLQLTVFLTAMFAVAELLSWPATRQRSFKAGNNLGLHVKVLRRPHA